jgi:hypothetical protein
MLQMVICERLESPVGLGVGGIGVTASPMLLVGLKEQLKEGQSLPLTLEFKTAGRMDFAIVWISAR